MQEIFKYMIELLKQGNFTTLVIIGFVVAFLWIFKEFRKTSVLKKEKTIDELLTSIEAHAKCLYQLNEYKYNRISVSLLNENLHLLLKYLDFNLSKQILEWDENDSDSLHKLIQENLNKLKAKKNHTREDNKKPYTIESIFLGIRKFDIDTFLIPLFSTMMFFLIIGFVFMLVYPGSKLHGLGIVFYVFSMITLFLFFIIFSTSVDILENNKEKRTPLNFSLVILLAIIGILIPLFDSLISLGIWIVFTWVYCFTFFRKLIN